MGSSHTLKPLSDLAESSVIDGVIMPGGPGRLTGPESKSLNGGKRWTAVILDTARGLVHKCRIWDPPYSRRNTGGSWSTS